MSRFEDEAKIALTALSRKPYAQQAQHFLNALWEEKFAGKPEECEKIWTFFESFCRCDQKNGKDGTELDEFEAHKFFEQNLDAMTVADMRKALKEADLMSNRMMSLVEFLIYHYKIDSELLVRWEPSGNAMAQKMLQGVESQMALANDALLVATKKAEEAKIEAEKAAEAAETAETAATTSELAAKEQQAATEELERQEKAKADALEIEEAKTRDDSLSVVKRNKAKAQLAILKNEDSQPLRTARITSGAAARKAAKAVKGLAIAAAASKDAADHADAAKLDAEAAMSRADNEVAELTEILEDAKANCSGDSGAPDGSLWWLDRAFEDSLRFMGPKQKAKALAARDASRKRKSGNFSLS